MEIAAAHWEPLDGGRVRCELCPHRCEIEDSQSGDCLTRTNLGGELVVNTYGRFGAVAMDPIEKKPLFHYRPGSLTFSVASAGCNLTCQFCQNHGISQALREDRAPSRSGRQWTARELVDATLAHGSVSISFTYSEPILQFELARDTAALAGPENVGLVFVTNGQANQAPAEEMAGFLAAANVDLKCFSAPAYRDELGGSLKATLRTIEILVRAGVWVEVTTLVIPGFNDSDEELTSIADFIAGLGPDIPWHVSRFHPDYKWMDRRATPVDTLARARNIGLARGLRYVYTGNIRAVEGERTCCPSCRAVVIDRVGYRIGAVATENGKCKSCGAQIAGVGLP